MQKIAKSLAAAALITCLAGSGTAMARGGIGGFHGGSFSGFHGSGLSSFHSGSFNGGSFSNFHGGNFQGGSFHAGNFNGFHGGGFHHGFRGGFFPGYAYGPWLYPDYTYDYSYYPSDYGYSEPTAPADYPPPTDYYQQPGVAYAPQGQQPGLSPYCATPRRVCLVRNASPVGAPCSCHVAGGLARGHIASQ